MKDTMVGAQLYTLHEYMQTPADIARMLAEVSKIGYRGVQVSGIGPIDRQELRRILDGEGLVACATHTDYDRLVKEIDLVVKEHKILGCTYIACPGLAREMHNAEGYRLAARELSRAGERLFGEGITLGYHNHALELVKYGDKTGLEILLSECDPRYLQAEIDTYWITYGGGDPAAWCARYRGRLEAVHLKDMAFTPENKPVFAEVGEGNLNWDAILSACRKAGTRWYLVEQDQCRRHPLESLKISLNNLKKRGLK